MKSNFLLFFHIILPCYLINAQNTSQKADSNNLERFSVHAQTTIINQFKPKFDAPYTGNKSLTTEEENQTSITSTLFLGAKLWKGASIFLNPEIAGGSGLSSAQGIAAATNGETFRVGSTAPQIYLARLFYRQIFALSTETTLQEGDFNQLKETIPTKYLSFTIGKIGVADYFDHNDYSHDPRRQFMSWALMDNGAWDYPANTRGYTPSIVLEYVTPKNEWRYGISLVPLVANGNKINQDISKASSHSLEYVRRYKIRSKVGSVRFLGFITSANMGNYNQSIALSPINPTIEATRQYGNIKYGFGINAEQKITNSTGIFFRASWNDGNNETWAFTEIDRSMSAGISISGQKWKRENDNIGFAYVVSGISKPHRDYLKAGGEGFMLGDGNLNYGLEHLTEFYYSAQVTNSVYLSGAYQMLVNPGYNKDRQGVVNVFSVRLHVRI